MNETKVGDPHLGNPVRAEPRALPRFRYTAALTLAPPLLAVLPILAFYSPILRMGLVAEDFQFALKGAKIGADIGELLRPFQLVWRPMAYLPFTLLDSLAGQSGIWYRAAQLGMVGALALAGWTMLRRVAGLGPWWAVGMVWMWMLSPLTDEVICGEMSFLGHLFFGFLVLLVITVRQRSGGWPRSVAVGVLLVLALLTKEEAVVLPAVFFLQDLLLRRIQWRRAVVAAAGWSVPVATYLLVYRAITHFGYRGFYDATPGTVLAKVLMTSAALFHLSPLVPWRFSEALAAHLLVGVAGGVLLVSLLAWLLVRRESTGLFLLAVAALLLLPTLLSSGQAARWTFLPWLLFLATVWLAVRRLREAFPVPRLLDVAAAGLALVVLGADAMTARGDLKDWSRFAALTRRLEGETAPLLNAARRGNTLLVLRGHDTASLQTLLFSPSGATKFYFPRPDDPYGVVSLSALLSWRTFREGFVLERVEAVPLGAPVSAYVHEEGGFRQLSSVPAVEVRHPSHVSRGVPGVILAVHPWSTFEPIGFP